MSKLVSGLRVLWQAKIHLQRAFVVITGLILMALICVQVAARYFFNTAIFGIEEVASYLAVWLYFIGSAIGAEQREHMSASLMDLVLRTEQSKRILKIFVGVISVVLCTWMTMWAYELAAWSIDLGMRSTETNVPVGLVQLAIPIGLGLMTLYFFFELIENLFFCQRSSASHA
jgi:TRAP-type C4-dicarboxylate transport system permease small subunit